MNQCTQCGKPVDPEDNFCQFCGFKMRNVEAKGSTSAPADCEAMRCEALSESGQPPVVEYHDDKENGLARATNPAIADGKSVEVHSAGDGCLARMGMSHSDGLALYINYNQLYVEGKAGVIEFKVENLSNDPFERVRVEVGGPLFERVACKNFSLRPCEAGTGLLHVRPDDSGFLLVEFRVIAMKDGQTRAFWADGQIMVFEKDQQLDTINMDIDKMVHIGNASGGDIHSNLIKNNIQVLVDRGQVRNFDELLREYRRLGPSFELLKLQFDPVWVDGPARRR